MPVPVIGVALLAEMPQALRQAIESSQVPEAGAPVSARARIETEIARGQDALGSGALSLGPSTPLTFPECGGTLAHIHEGSLLRFRCHTGHAFSADTLMQASSEKIDDKLWQALRAMAQPRGRAARHVAERGAARSAGPGVGADALTCQCDDRHLSIQQPLVQAC
jgi:two-component system, chemotaxis family, protein-glutamate methylesterase/glutaminase